MAGTLIADKESSMTDDAKRILARMDEDREATQQALEAQCEMLRLVLSQVSLILEALTAKVGDGPTLQEILAELVARIAENAAVLRRIDRRTDSMATSLPNDIVRAMQGVSGANGNGASGDHSP